jgi:hypothetical protein
VRRPLVHARTLRLFTDSTRTVRTQRCASHTDTADAWHVVHSTCCRQCTQHDGTHEDDSTQQYRWQVPSQADRSEDAWHVVHSTCCRQCTPRRGGVRLMLRQPRLLCCSFAHSCRSAAPRLVLRALLPPTQHDGTHEARGAQSDTTPSTCQGSWREGHPHGGAEEEGSRGSEETKATEGGEQGAAQS